MSTRSDALSLRGRNVMVTGGAGFIGSHLVDRIVAEEPGSVVVVDNLFLGKEDNLAVARGAFPRLKLYVQDATDYDEIGAILAAERIEVVFNLAIVPLPASLVNPRWTVDHNIGLTTVPCELLRQGYFETLIHFSSSEAYGSAHYVPMDETHPPMPSTPYAASKVASDQVVLAYRHTYGADVAILRPFNNFGPRQNAGAYAGVIPVVLGRAMRGMPVMIYGDGEQTRDFIFVRDTAEAAIAMYGEPATRGEIVNIASGTETTINHLVRELLAVMGCDVPIQYQESRRGDVRRHRAAIDRAKALLGFEPRTPLAEGLAETVEWYRGRLEMLPIAPA